MQCSNCGFNNDSEAKFCENCGATLPAAGSSSDAASQVGGLPPFAPPSAPPAPTPFAPAPAPPAPPVPPVAPTPPATWAAPPISVKFDSPMVAFEDGNFQYDVAYPEDLSRGLIFIKWLLIIPHLIVLG